MTTGAPEILRSVGLLADGPVVWGRPLGSRTAGIFVVELPEPKPSAPIELTLVGKWLERVPDLRLDGEHPTSKALAARLAAFWLPSATVLYVGATDGSIGGRVEAIRNTVLGDRRPHSGGHWLHTLRGLDRARIWWAPTDAAEEYEDAILEAFAATIPAAELAALPDMKLVLPFANLRSATGQRKATGLANSLIPDEVGRPVAARRVVEVPPGAADGAGGLPPSRAAGGTVRRSPRPVTAAASPRPAPAPARSPSAGPASRAAAEPTWVSADGIARLRTEHEQLVKVRRPEVIARIKAAKELGDLKETADYTAAREEQSFLEGRIASIEATLRTAQVIEVRVDEDRATLGSTVAVEDPDGLPATYTIVGSTEADPATGRISNVSPVGKALMGARAGDEVTVAAPRGSVRYRVVAIS
jgi:transcription elongation factor GreA